MWAALGGLFSGLLSGAGSLFGGAMSSASSEYAARKAYDAQKETNEINYQMFKENMQWQTQMANTAHQREVKDLRDAGLNPVLSATGGSGAVTPNLSSPVMSSPGPGVADQSENIYRMVMGVTNGLSSAADIALKIASVKKSLADTKKTEKETKEEVGKRNPFMWSVNALQDSSAGLAEFAKQAGGLIGDLTKGMRTQINYMQKVYQYNSARGVKNAQGLHDFGGSDQPGWINFDR